MSEEEQQPHLQIVKINSAFTGDNIDKFLKGQKEHGGNFFEKPSVRCIREEAIDLVNYTHVLELHRIELCNIIDRLTEKYAKAENDFELYQELLGLQSKIRKL